MASVTRKASQERAKARWILERDEYFIQLMISQLQFGWKKSDNGFTKHAWNTMTYEFNRKFRLQFDRSQLKNRQTVLKKLYNAFKKLTEQSGFCWHEAQQSVTAENEVWDQYLMGHPEAQPFRYKGFPQYTSLSILYEGKSAKGAQIGTNIPSDVPQENNLWPALSQDVSALGLDTVPEESKSSSASMPPRRNARQKKRSSEPPSISRNGKKLRSNSSNMLARAIAEMATACKSATEAMLKSGMNEKYSYERCMEELQELEGLDDSEFRKAVRLLRDEKHAIAFMLLKGPRRLMWLKSECGEPY